MKPRTQDPRLRRAKDDLYSVLRDLGVDRETAEILIARIPRRLAGKLYAQTVPTRDELLVARRPRSITELENEISEKRSALALLPKTFTVRFGTGGSRAADRAALESR